MIPVFIYALLDPRTGILRYCGQTGDPDIRLNRHLREAKKEKNKYHNARWIRALWVEQNLRKNAKLFFVVDAAIHSPS